ncbi:hypothetical protein FB45DRAFT_1030813 [Roridomyces roridus]|uniref:Uncharacterized protein n=1 Tax=Roridomyces roridus TaxID=1738132 RepID=A0AAD7BM59_9AGAR|nr:hypothetical protein FB45DRAFT_1030813 [Roridomyces roridus]
MPSQSVVLQHGHPFGILGILVCLASAFRLSWKPTAKMRDIPELEWLYDSIVGTRSVVSTQGPLRMLYIYPCLHGTLINVVAFYSDTSDGTAGWSGHATVDGIQDHISRLPS